MNLGMPEMLFIGLLALLILGPRKLPEVGRQLGRGISEFKRASSGLKEQFEQECRELDSQACAEKTTLNKTHSAQEDPATTVIGRTRALLASVAAPSLVTSTESSQAETGAPRQASALPKTPLAEV